MDAAKFFLHYLNGAGHSAYPQLSPDPTAPQPKGAGQQDTGQDVRRQKGRRWGWAGAVPLSLTRSGAGRATGDGPGSVSARWTSGCRAVSPGGRGPGRGRGQTSKKPEVRPGTVTPPSKKNLFPQRGPQRHMGGEPKTHIHLDCILTSDRQVSASV